MDVVELVMWGGAAVAFLGFTLTWTYNWGLEVLWLFEEETVEEIGRWLMRVGAAVAVAAAVVLLVGGR